MKKINNKSIAKVLLKTAFVLTAPILLITLGAAATGVGASILLCCGLVSLAGTVISLPDIFNNNISKEAIEETSKDINIIVEVKNEQLIKDNVQTNEIQRPLCTNLIDYFNEIDKVEEYKPYTKKLTR